MSARTSRFPRAQTAKYRALAQGMGLQAGQSVLEIGCGWGGFAEFAAREVGAKVTGITISEEQFKFAKARMQAQGLSERADIRFVDYRDVDGQFDRVASIEMFEAVGERYWPAYFAKIHERPWNPAVAPACRSSPSATRISRTIAAARTSSRSTSSRAACCRRKNA